MKYALLVATALVTLGCANWVRVNPVALTAYNHAATVESPGGGLHIRTMITMRTLSNRMIEVRANDYIRLTLVDGTVHELYPPLEVVFENGRMVISSQHAAPQTYQPEQLKSVEVQTSN